MSIVAYSNTEIAASGLAAEKPKSFWRKIYDRMVESQQERAEKNVAAYLETHGGLLTDEMEREIMTRFSANSALRRAL